MQWEHLTSRQFPEAVQECRGVGIVPIGVIEPHSAHLPLGTDMLVAHWLACRAAERETAVVFPPYPFGINHESAHLPGSVVVKRRLVFDLLENICDEMSRQGLKKIVLLSGHGGNRYFLPLFVQTLVEQEKDYVAYFHHTTPAATLAGKAVLETPETGHAGEWETSVAHYIHGELIRKELIPKTPFWSLKRNEPLRGMGVYSPMDWYAMYPAMYVGDASRATREKGKVIVKARLDELVRVLHAVKNDAVTPVLMQEFLEGRRRPASHPAWDSPTGEQE